MKIVKFEYSLFGINTYVVFDPQTKDCAIIDPGMINDEEREAMAHFISSNGLRVTDVINTHLHIDHAIGNDWARRNYGIIAAAHPADVPLGERLTQQAQMFGMSEEVKDIEDVKLLKDGQVIKIGNGELEVIHVPGHSPGSVALYDAADGFLISGDALFAGSIGRTDLPGGSMPQLLESIRKRLLTLPGDTMVYPGHGPATTISHELRSNPFLKA